jgi:hypothetical protein
MVRRSKNLDPADKQRRQAAQRERDRLDAITALTKQLTCLVTLAQEVADDCEGQLEDLEFDLATSRLAIEFWADNPAAHDIVAMIAELEIEHQRHCATVSALADRFDAFVHSQANLEHVHLRPSEPYRQRVEERLFPSAAPSR